MKDLTGLTRVVSFRLPVPVYAQLLNEAFESGGNVSEYMMGALAKARKQEQNDFKTLQEFAELERERDDCQNEMNALRQEREHLKKQLETERKQSEEKFRLIQSQTDATDTKQSKEIQSLRAQVAEALKKHSDFEKMATEKMMSTLEKVKNLEKSNSDLSGRLQKANAFIKKEAKENLFSPSDDKIPQF